MKTVTIKCDSCGYTDKETYEWIEIGSESGDFYFLRKDRKMSKWKDLHFCSDACFIGEFIPHDIKPIPPEDKEKKKQEEIKDIMDRTEALTKNKTK